ncbi:MAG: SDR family oxidoreductase [Methanoregula sp.]|jgi:3-oxoacyl-[acyl-carrier protein] reductase|uniref:SDR family NAD(P)-dependent oxidoreductase n=1 Tax=Methanoregula sp. TaxID=2052170 RepID=UPI003C19CCF8
MIPSRRLVIITGATRGLGRQIADRFRTTGDDLVLVARHETDLVKTTEELSCGAREHQNIHYFAADLSDPAAIPKLIAEIQSNAGNPDIVINNAAIQGPIGPVHTNDWNEWQTCLNVCLLAPVQFTRGFLPGMIEKKYGRIVNISGGGATAPRANFSSYATAKCGLVRFSETLAQEVREYGITVNCVAPGAMSSNLTKNIISAGKEYAGSAEFESALHISQENPHTENRAADLVHFLTTDACATITGKLISAIWDPWEKLPDAALALMNSDVYTLRRIIPQDRNLTVE